MKKVLIEYQGNDYELKPLTIETWNAVQIAGDLQEGYEFIVNLISMMTGISQEDVLKAKRKEIDKAFQYVQEYITQKENKFYSEFEFDGKKYKFIDLENITFGEFIDLDTFLQKSEVERKKELNLLMALLYRETDDNGVIRPYNAIEVKARAESFKNLDMKYVQGALLFFSTFVSILRRNTRLSSTKKMLNKVRWMTLRSFLNFGVGTGRLYYWLKKTFLKLTKWLRNHFLFVLIC